MISGSDRSKDSPLREGVQVKIELVKSWAEDPIVELYKSGGWWRDYMDETKIPELIRRSYLFAVAVDMITGRTIGMGRVISDGISDAYIQDLVILPLWRKKNIGRMIVSVLIDRCVSSGITWICLVAQPGTDTLYRSLGFEPMAGHVPMLLHGDR